MSLYDQLTAYGQSDAYPMHMPGHKRNTEKFSMKDPYGWDITEIDGFDDLHEPEGILAEGMRRAAELYGAAESWYLINGSTAGILAGISACTRPGDRVLMARNCHKSVYHAVALNQLTPVYLHPAVDPVSGILASIDPIDVELALASHEISLVVLTSPTYEGILSDIQMIAAICHRRGVPLLVDEAHGAHLSSGKLYTSCFPEGAVSCGADLVVQSLHKTLPALTQTGLIHRQGSLVSGARVKHALDIYQTSSPSYILMAGIDRCVRWMETDGSRLLGSWAERLRYFYRRMDGLHSLSVVTLDTCERFFAWDPSKLVISTRGTGHTGRELMEILRREYRLELEMASGDYVIAMTGAGDTEEGIQRFADAVLAIDAAWSRQDAADGKPIDVWGQFCEKVYCTPSQAEPWAGEYIPLAAEALGKISLEFVYAYPPGIPVLVPGEEVTECVLHVIEAYEKAGIPMRGYERQTSHELRVMEPAERLMGSAR